MAVSGKYRRHIKYKERAYVWYVCEDDDYCGWEMLHIISEDKCLILTLPLRIQPSYVISQGRDFQGQRNEKGCWRRYLTPKWDNRTVTPGLVARVIEWATEGDSAEEVVWSRENFRF